MASGRGSSCSRKSGSGSVVGGEGSGESSQGSAGVIGEGVGGDGGASSVTGEDEVKVEMPEEGSEVWQQVMASLLDRFQNWTDQFSIPCFVSSEAPKSELDPVPYRYVSLIPISPYSDNATHPFFSSSIHIPHIPIPHTPIPMFTDQRTHSTWR